MVQSGPEIADWGSGGKLLLQRGLRGAQSIDLDFAAFAGHDAGKNAHRSIASPVAKMDLQQAKDSTFTIL
jgi:hypothetical protein